MFQEIYGISRFEFFINQEQYLEPFMPVLQYSYEAHPMNSYSEISGAVFFGTSGASNKRAIFDYFFSEFQVDKERYQQLVHPTSYLALSSKLEKGVLIEPKTVIGSQSSIGFGVFVKRGASIGHHNSIGDFTDINPGAVLSGKVNVGPGCTIGSGAVIKDNINIGANTVIGIGSVVTKDIPANCIAFGNPCKVVKEI
ncbi:Acetyltransferase (isoleucine patch superfamily) [Indibacter alkaliphilus LW1]|uniref:Acetyltransferase (Isoleucine patch superfamily) n=2 Tax=Cyclobacteriaceae TaxID=563798 RepID=S2D905_INDAL|nr:acetyltransferase [Indibacter alkaliphilus]EOZ95702.1 Acetyltransferase (isoleucine patch superfamily) [Indibacter alkaliphilus LW1]